MTSTPSGIIKKDHVKMTEAPRNLGDMAPSAPAIRIVEQDETGALVEVTCECGRTTYVQCEYAPSPGA